MILENRKIIKFLCHEISTSRELGEKIGLFADGFLRWKLIYFRLPYV